MFGKTHTIRRKLTALALGATIAAFVVPAGQASDRVVDDYFRDAHNVTAKASDRIVDDYFRDYLRNAGQAPQTSDRIVDDYFRDSSPIGAQSSNPSGERSTAGGIGWDEVGVGIGAAMGGLLLLTALGLGARQARHARHPLGSA